ncbi:MAG: FtsQ-type POTRA domain-containing protein [candidate division Zixibacteria bacterium]|nr:FtsQ-type POTRA domain-containing protein [candidate division Zixibacteria bacterium]
MKKIALIGSLALILLWVRTTELFLTRSSIFGLKVIEITGNEDLSKDEILKYSQLRLNRSIFIANLTDISKRIEADRRVKKVTFKRILPGKIQIRVEEKKPDLLVISKSMSKLYGLTLEGEVIPMKDNFSYDLPLLNCAGFKDLKPYTKIVDTEIQIALSFYNIIKEVNPSFLWEISEINFEDRNNLVVVLIKSGAELFFGTDNLKEKFKRYLQLNKDINLEGYSRLDLRFKDQMIFTGIKKSS